MITRHLNLTTSYPKELSIPYNNYKARVSSDSSIKKIALSKFSPCSSHKTDQERFSVRQGSFSGLFGVLSISGLAISVITKMREQIEEESKEITVASKHAQIDHKKQFMMRQFAAASAIILFRLGISFDKVTINHKDIDIQTIAFSFSTNADKENMVCWLLFKAEIARKTNENRTCENYLHQAKKLAKELGYNPKNAAIFFYREKLRAHTFLKENTDLLQETTIALEDNSGSLTSEEFRSIMCGRDFSK